MIQSNYRSCMGVSSVSCTYCIDLFFKRDDANSTAPGHHGGDHRPLVGLWIVTLSRLQALKPVETTTDINLWRKGATVIHKDYAELKSRWPRSSLTLQTFSWSVAQLASLL